VTSSFQPSAVSDQRETKEQTIAVSYQRSAGKGTGSSQQELKVNG